MEFRTPTSIDEMEEILGEIFCYYRLRREEYQKVELQPLRLSHLRYTKPSQQQIVEIATGQLAGAQKREILKYKAELSAQIKAKTALLEKRNAQLEQGVKKLEETYDNAKQKYIEWAQKRGVTSNSTVEKTLIDYDLKLVKEINAFKTPIEVEIATVEGELIDLNEKLQNADGYFDEVFQLELENKKTELSEQYDKTVRDVNKYNNSLDEKTQRYDNTIIEAGASLKLKYMQIEQEPIPKEELVRIGYYRDVINCVSSYLDTLNALDAYEVLTENKNIIAYLDDFYSTLLYAYKLRIN
ncbi:MAG: hypothetical protein IKZ38_03390 [Clostridia bacterium]|nr:hypothetical protein [Clostridia bacterium]